MATIWRDGRVVAGPARWLLISVAGLSVILAGIVWSRGFDPAAITGLEMVLWLARLILFVAAAILTLRWIYLANLHARAVGADDMMVRPGWAVGWFFVPLLNLVMPFIAMRELWKASVNPRDWQAESASLLVPLWWAFWIGCGIAGGLSFSLAMEPSVEALSAAEVAGFVSLLLALPSALLLERIVAGIQARLDRFAPGGVEALQRRFA